ncbi:pre-mRNA-processing factor 39 isoform X2 [Panulirus ornatus]|uniref:pre-mRNA-processing factor 39 isoform X2 n=2 Tax=Panulirus ornatus TaxID=150431 RepID=UPI003A844F21
MDEVNEKMYRLESEIEVKQEKDENIVEMCEEIEIKEEVEMNKFGYTEQNAENVKRLVKTEEAEQKSCGGNIETYENKNMDEVNENMYRLESEIKVKQEKDENIVEMYEEIEIKEEVEMNELKDFFEQNAENVKRSVITGEAEQKLSGANTEYHIKKMESQTGVQMPGSPLLSEMIREEILDGEIPTEPSVECPELSLNSDKTSMVKEEDIGEGNVLKRPSSASPSEDEPASKKRSNEVDKLWKNVHDNPNDFQAWTLLLQHIDQVSDLESGREAYDGFFERYPYCYGYWKKFADLERRKGTKETTCKVFNRGLEAIRLSVDLWLHYMEYITTQFPDNEAFVRQEFERAIETCGLEFKSDKLWEAYIAWESAGKRWKNVTLLYERLLATPTSKYMQHWQKFQDHVKKHLPSEVIGVDEFLSLRREVLAELNKSDTETPDEAPPGVEAAPGDEQVGTNVDEETKALQKSIIAARQKIHDVNVIEVKALWSYEDAIKRPYFHVKPLEKSQLTAWRNYLDYEIKQMNAARIRVLFERCLIACAFYEEFWMRYIRYLEEAVAGDAEIRSVYQRACIIHLREKFRPHLSWAAFEEEKGNSDRALEILEDVQARVPGSLEAWMQAAGVERRRGNLEAAKEIFLRCLQQCQEREDKNAYSHVALKFARFHTLFCGNPEKAVEILKEAHEYNKENSNVLLALVDQVLICQPPRFQEATQALKEGIEYCQQPGSRLMFAHRLFHFMSECGQDTNSVSEGLRILRQVQEEMRQMDSALAEIDTGSNTSKQGEVAGGGIAVVESRREKRSSQEKSSPGPMNGTTNTTNQAMVANYQGYQQSGYGGYNQGYTHGYGASHYQGWGYPTQQGGYGYGQQGWGTYGNYYGQR